MGGRRLRIGDPGFSLDVNGAVFDKVVWRQSIDARLPVLERGAMPTVRSDVINRHMDQIAGQLINQVTLATAAVKLEKTITLEAGHLVEVGDEILMTDLTDATDPHLYTACVLGVATNVISLDRGIDFDYPVSSFAGRLTTQMAVNGSSTESIFLIQAPIGFKFDVTRLLITMTLTSAPDDGLFGNLAAIANGVTMRLVRNYDNSLGDPYENAQIYNRANWKDNGEIASSDFDVVYTSRSGGQGNFGLRSRWSFGGEDKMGAVIRLRGGENRTVQQGPQDRLELVVSDDLSTLGSFKMHFQGHWVDIVWNGN